MTEDKKIIQIISRICRDCLLWKAITPYEAIKTIINVLSVYDSTFILMLDKVEMGKKLNDLILKGKEEAK